MHTPLVPPSLSPRLCRTHTRISLFFSCAEIHGRVEEVESEPLVAIENREKKSVLKTFFVAKRLHAYALLPYVQLNIAIANIIVDTIINV